MGLHGYPSGHVTRGARCRDHGAGCRWCAVLPCLSVGGGAGGGGDAASGVVGGGAYSSARSPRRGRRHRRRGEHVARGRPSRCRRSRGREDRSAHPDGVLEEMKASSPRSAPRRWGATACASAWTPNRPASTWRPATTPGRRALPRTRSSTRTIRSCSSAIRARTPKNPPKPPRSRRAGRHDHDPGQRGDRGGGVAGHDQPAAADRPGDAEAPAPAPMALTSTAGLPELMRILGAIVAPPRWSPHCCCTSAGCTPTTSSPTSA